MDTSKSYVKIYNISLESSEDFEFDYDIETDDLLTEMAPNLDEWGDIGWMELEDYEYNPHGQTMHITLDTKWAAPVQWLRQMSQQVPYFANKLITMATIQKDETLVTGVAVMDGEILQNKQILEKTSEEVGRYYSEDETGHDLDRLDNEIWDSIGKFVNVCEQYYLERGKDDA